MDHQSASCRMPPPTGSHWIAPIAPALLSWRLVADPRYRPEIICKPWVRDVVVGHVEAAAVAPVQAPGVEEHEDLEVVAVSHGAGSVAALDLLIAVSVRHRHLPGKVDGRGAEVAVDDEPKDEGLAHGEAPLQLRECLLHRLVARRSEGLPNPVARRGRPLVQLGVVVGPRGLRADPPELHRLQAVPEAGRDLVGTVGLHKPQVVVDEAEARHKVRPPLPVPLLLVEVEGRGDGARNAAAGFAGVGRQALLVRTQIHLLRQPRIHHLPEVSQAISRVGRVWHTGEEAAPLLRRLPRDARLAPAAVALRQGARSLLEVLLLNALRQEGVIVWDPVFFLQGLL
mmetsp:Transcript_8535/g.23969  ORF Transcript_8535/g.23969 Transcript_8535/m.23969 type:complete len:341 (+) Transcript_8535:14-1036(+)